MITEFQPGEVISAERINELVRALNAIALVPVVTDVKIEKSGGIDKILVTQVSSVLAKR